MPEGKYASPVPTNFPKKYIEKLAEKLAEVLEFEPGDDIFSTALKLGGKINFGSTGSDDEESGSLIAKSVSDWVIYLSPMTSQARDRFTIAHELGHLFLHFPKNDSRPMRATRYMKEENPTHRRAEWEANWFAAALLMPEKKFRKKYTEEGDIACRLHFQMSASAVRARAESLGLLGR